MPRVGQAIDFLFQFTNAGAGATGLTVTADIYDVDKSLLVNNASCTELADGVYYYTLALASNDAAGTYVGIATTAGTVDVNDVVYATDSYGSLDLTESTSGTGLPLTLSGLRRELRIWLNDLTSDGDPGGNYITEVLDHCINYAYRDTVVECKTRKASKSVTLVNGTHTYDLDEMFEPVEVILGAVPLEHTSLKDRGVSLQTWNSSAGGIPSKWMHLIGPQIRILATPDATATGVISVVADAPIAGGTGYAVNDLLTLAGGTDGQVKVTAVSAGVVTEVQLYAGGYSYTTGTKATTTTGAGTGCTISITTVGTLTINGYSHPTVLTNDADTVDALPDGYAVQAILTRAASLARQIRSTYANNVSLANDLDRLWLRICEDIKDSIKADGN